MPERFHNVTAALGKEGQGVCRPWGKHRCASRFVLTCKAGVVWILTKSENQSASVKK